MTITRPVPLITLCIGSISLAWVSSMPAQMRQTGESKSNAWIATIPIAPDGGKSVFVSVAINGQAAQWWVVDTGSSECIIDRGVARKLGLTIRGDRQIHGAGRGTVRLDSIRGNVWLKLAGEGIPTCDHFAAIDLSQAGAQAHRRIAGILGHEFFMRYVVRLDFGAHTLQLYDPTRFRYAGGGDAIALTFVRKLPRVAVRIRTANRPEVTRHLIVDTGSEDAVDDSTVRRSSRGDPITVPTTGLGASYEAVIGTLDTVRLGRSVFTAVPGVASDVGIVGNEIWSRFVCTFDFAHRRLFLERRRGP